MGSAGAVQRAVRALVAAMPDLVVITDVCLCEYTEHGHCGVLDGERILNDATVERLVRVRDRRTPRPARTSSRRPT